MICLDSIIKKKKGKWDIKRDVKKKKVKVIEEGVMESSKNSGMNIRLSETSLNTSRKYSMA